MASNSQSQPVSAVPSAQGQQVTSGQPTAPSQQPTIPGPLSLPSNLTSNWWEKTWLSILLQFLTALGTLAVPLVIGIATIAFSNQQNATTLQVARDQQHEVILKAYLDDINDLLLNRNLLTSRSGDAVRLIAQTDTLSSLRQLDSLRSNYLLLYLRDEHLIGNLGKNDIISFASTDLRNDHLEYSNLNNIDLVGANLSCTYLTGADLRGADLSNSNLSCAHLSNANLGGTNLNNANLSGADLRGASVTQLQLSHAKSLHGALMKG